MMKKIIYLDDARNVSNPEVHVFAPNRRLITGVVYTCEPASDVLFELTEEGIEHVLLGYTDYFNAPMDVLTDNEFTVYQDETGVRWRNDECVALISSSNKIEHRDIIDKLFKSNQIEARQRSRFELDVVYKYSLILMLGGKVPIHGGYFPTRFSAEEYMKDHIDNQKPLEVLGNSLFKDQVDSWFILEVSQIGRISILQAQLP